MAASAAMEPSRATVEAPYHEEQRWRHCAKHSINALLQGHENLFSVEDLYAIGQSMPDSGVGAFSRSFLNPHFSFFGGNFDVNVLMVCAEQRDCVLEWFDRRKPPGGLVADEMQRGLGFLANVRRRHLFGALSSNHWYAIRPPTTPSGCWWRIDSLESGPMPRTAEEIVVDIATLLATPDGNLLVLRRSRRGNAGCGGSDQ